jgi:para-nitrobenzyl esterase
MNGPLVECPAGRIRGRRSGDLLRFDGIPFAAAPVGHRRFRPPEPPPRNRGEIDATQHRPAPLQRPGPALGSRPVGATSEDCLHLNLVTPSPDGRRPVMVWIHGGGYVNGSASDPIHLGERLVTRGDLVLVTFDYRLGVFGFLHPEDAPNPGLRDQIAALQWVRDNVSAFGGDPDRVTLFGESAGAMSIRALMAAPAADELFHAAMLQSGAGVGVESPAGAEMVRTRMAAELGSDDWSRWQALPGDRLLDAQVRVGEEIRAETGRGAWRPMVDGELVRSSGQQAQAREINRRRPVLMGMNAHEQRLFVNPRRPISRAEAVTRLARTLAPIGTDAEDRAAAVLARHEQLDPEASEATRLAAAETDLFFRIPMLRFCNARAGAPAATFQYLFRWPSPALRGRLGACHALEIPFVFGTLDAPGMERFAGTGEDARALSQAMIGAWSAFAHAGSPEGAVPDWQPWTPEEHRCWIADRNPHMEQGPDEDALDVWRSILPEGGF